MGLIRIKQVLIDQDLDVNTNKIIGVVAGVADTDGVNVAQLNAVVAGLEWQDSAVTALLDPTAETPAAGDRYLVNGTGATGFAGHDNEIATYVAGDVLLPASWTFTLPTTGMHISVDDNSDHIFYYSGAAWVEKSFATVVDGTTVDLTMTLGAITAEVQDASLTAQYIDDNGAPTAGDVLTATSTAAGSDFTWVAASSIGGEPKELVADAAFAGPKVTATKIYTNCFAGDNPRAADVPAVFVNGHKVEVGQVGEETTADCYFAATGTTTPAINFASLLGSEDLIWYGPATGADYAIDTADEIQLNYSI